MSKSEVTVSPAEQGVAEQDSVFDFLYHDSRRIASFLSQFDNNGHLTGITQGESVAKGAKRSKKIGLSGNSPFGGGGLEFEIGPGETGAQSLERAYDPFWTNARLFLDVLTERSMIQRDIGAANIGQFVLASGFLSIQDLAMFKDAWRLPSIQRKVKAGATGGKKAGNMTTVQKAELREQQENTDMLLDMMQILPHSVHARMLTSGDGDTKLVWCTLDQNCLVAPASDITLTYGATMAGEWSILGILSAYPEYLTPDLNQENDFESFGLLESVVGQVSNVLAPIVRVTLGRPAAAFAVTPLLIFREAS
ncbi:MAG: hypothetical protein ACKVOP_07440 [Sphingomonadaceae bacterium]